MWSEPNHQFEEHGHPRHGQAWPGMARPSRSSARGWSASLSGPQNGVAVSDYTP